MRWRHLESGEELLAEPPGRERKLLYPCLPVPVTARVISSAHRQLGIEGDSHQLAHSAF